MLMIQLCDALQRGVKFLGFPTRQHNCLYIQADSGLIEWKKQIEMLAPESTAWTAHQIERGFLDDPTERQRLHQLVWGTYPEDSPMYTALQGKPFNFVIFDCLHALTDGDLNTKTTMSTVLKHIDEIVTKEGEAVEGQNNKERVHYLLVHHPNAMVKRGATAGSGHKGFSDACSTKLTLGSNLLVLEKSKVTSKKEILLERSDIGAWFKQDAEEEFDYSSILGN